MALQKNVDSGTIEIVQSCNVHVANEENNDRVVFIPNENTDESTVFSSKGVITEVTGQKG